MDSYLIPSVKFNHCNDGEYQRRSACQNKIRLFLEEPKLLIRLFIHALLRNVHLVKQFVSINKFKEIIFSFIRHKDNSVFAIHVTRGSKFLKSSDLFDDPRFL